VENLIIAFDRRGKIIAVVIKKMTRTYNIIQSGKINIQQRTTTYGDLPGRRLRMIQLEQNE